MYRNHKCATHQPRHLFWLYFATIFIIASLVLYLFYPFFTTQASSPPTYIEISDLFGVAAEHLGIDPTIDAFIEAKVIKPSEATYFTELSSVPRIVAWRILLPAYEVYPYPASFFPNQYLPSHISMPSTYLDTWATALNAGLAPAGDSPYQYMTIKEFRLLVETLESGSITINTPASDCPFIDPNFEWSLETYLGRNSLLAAWPEIPLSWREDFIQSGWNIEFTLPESTESNDDFQILGTTSYRTKTIHLGSDSPSVSFHEFGHFASYRTSYWDQYIKPCFESESPFVAEILGSYSLTAPREYLAEFISCWLDQPDLRSTLYSLAPRTSKLVIEIIDHYDLLLSNAP